MDIIYVVSLLRSVSHLLESGRCTDKLHKNLLTVSYHPISKIEYVFTTALQ